MRISEPSTAFLGFRKWPGNRVTSRGVVALAALSMMVSPASTQQGPPSVAPVAERLFSAVVSISSTQIAKGQPDAQPPPVPKGSPFEDLFDDFFNNRGGRDAPGERRVSSLGSGFVIDGELGLIVTNNHVIEGADEIEVNFSDGTKLKVDKVLGRDTKTDLALLKVTPKTPLPSVKFGSSSSMKVGDWVMAIGNPFGLGGSVSLGIISATQRDIHSGPYDDFLQTDAAINKGNSGGPLFNMAGEVIGVNTAIISPSGGSIGIGFAVPSDIAQVVIDQLKDYGEPRRGWLGVKIQSVSENIAASLGVDPNLGAIVSAITPGSPAAAAGFEVGDLILRFDGKDVTRVRGLPRLVAQTPIGKTIDVEILRKTERKTLQVAIGRLVEEDETKKKEEIVALPPKDAPTAKSEALTMGGLVLSPVTDALRKKFGLSAGIEGVVVTEIAPGSAAATKSIAVGDVILQAAQEKVTSLEELSRRIEAVRKSGNLSILLLVEDGKGQQKTVALPVQ